MPCEDACAIGCARSATHERPSSLSLQAARERLGIRSSEEKEWAPLVATDVPSLKGEIRDRGTWPSFLVETRASRCAWGT